MRTTDSDETEILLGNKQLLGIFFVVALLLGVAFYGGYMVGRNGSARRSLAATVAQEEPPATAPAAAGGETHVVPPGSGTVTDQSTKTDMAPAQEPPLGSAKRRTPPAETPEGESGARSNEAFAPQVGQQFLQVAAVSRDEAEAVADVLQKKGFRAHAVPKPGNPKLYRVIIGPIRDTADLSSTRDALMRTGFREVILQRY